MFTVARWMLIDPLYPACTFSICKGFWKDGLGYPSPFLSRWKLPITYGFQRKRGAKKSVSPGERVFNPRGRRTHEA